MVAKKGSIARPCEELRLAQPTTSGQLRASKERFLRRRSRSSGKSAAGSESLSLADLAARATETFVISAERKIKHPAATVIAEVAKRAAAR